MKTNIDILSKCTMSIFLSESRYEIAFKIFKKTGTKLKTDDRFMQMYLFGGTIGWSKSPMYQMGSSTNNHMLPLPVISCHPGNYGYFLIHSNNWLGKLTKIIERLTIDF